jgi:5-hydroxyisourate hydrolase-like protein (transthyretin family)
MALQYGLADFRVKDQSGKPVAGAEIRLKTIGFDRKEYELVNRTDEDGRILFAVPQQLMPQLPTEADYQIGTAKGIVDRGKVRCGGNEEIRTREVVLQS